MRVGGRRLPRHPCHITQHAVTSIVSSGRPWALPAFAPSPDEDTETQEGPSDLRLPKDPDEAVAKPPRLTSRPGQDLNSAGVGRAAPGQTGLQTIGFRWFRDIISQSEPLQKTPRGVRALERRLLAGFCSRTRP